MAIQIERISDTKIWVHDGTVSIAVFDTALGAVIEGALTIGSDLVSPSASELAAINGMTATAAELNYLDIATLGTGAASKAVVLDAGDDYTWPATGVLKTGVLKDKDGVILSSTNTQLNTLVTSPIINKISETVAYAQFTDGGGTTGTYTMTAPGIPATAVVLYAVVTAVTGFTGDTTALLSIGDGTDVDRYNTGLYDVFGNAALGLDVTAPSGLIYHTVTKQPVIAITKATDWGAGTTGSVSVKVIYIN
jgi:hypothetical protein